MREIIVDNFAGGGGASTGIEMAIGRSVDIAINHDPAAIAMHKANHPGTEHYCESVWDVDPRKAAAGRPIALCWLSPDCRHFSKAKGAKPVQKSIRGLAWVAVRWAATVRPRVIILENVEEFKTWGPLLKNGMPDPDKKGRTFNAFINALKRQGYQVDYRELRACDYGAPTIRKRFFLVARCDGMPIVWPQPTHGDPESAAVKAGRLEPWHIAAEIIDWSLPCPSIFERRKPLADNTLKRIARGIQKFVMNNPKPFIVRIGQIGFGGDRLQYELDKPLTTITAKAEHLLVSPTLVQVGYGERDGQAPRALDPERPLGTVVAGGNKFGMVATFLSKYHGAKSATDVRGQVPDDPITTVDTSNRFGLVSAFLAKHYGGNYIGPGANLDGPLHTVTAADHNALVTTHLVKVEETENQAQVEAAFISKGYAGCSRSVASGLDSGLHTVTARQAVHSLVTTHLVKLKGTNIGQPATDPVQTITAGGLHFGEVRAFLMAYYGTSVGSTCDEPLQTVTTKDRFGLVKVQGQDYQIVDIGMRMLEPHELFAAQGFPDSYIINRDHEGKPYSKKDQVARCGNAVPPPFAQALVRANLPELCSGTSRFAAGERREQYVSN